MPAPKKPKAPKKRTDRRGAPKGRKGNPPFVATDEQRSDVLSLVAAGAQQWIVARALRISKDTLIRHFKVELEHGKQLVDAKVGGAITRKALDGDPDMQKFYAARRAGWKATTAIEQSGPDGGPIRYANEPPRRDLSAFSEEELEQYERLTAKLEAPRDPGDQ